MVYCTNMHLHAVCPGAFWPAQSICMQLIRCSCSRLTATRPSTTNCSACLREPRPSRASRFAIRSESRTFSSLPGLPAEQVLLADRVLRGFCTGSWAKPAWSCWPAVDRSPRFESGNGAARAQQRSWRQLRRQYRWHARRAPLAAAGDGNAIMCIWPGLGCLTVVDLDCCDLRHQFSSVSSDSVMQRLFCLFLHVASLPLRILQFILEYLNLARGT